MALKVAILDDEKHAGETLSWQLRKSGVPVEIVGVYTDPRIALQELPGKTCDLIFLDIEMPLLNGFQFLEKLNSKTLQVIFTTAYDKFAVKAFRVNAVDYLLKPIDSAELEAALKKALHEKSQLDMGKLRSIFDGFATSQQQSTKLALPSVHGIDFIETKDIIYCQSESNYTRLYLEDNKKLLISKTLKEIEQMLPPTLFFRVHNSYVANVSKIKRFLRAGSGTLIMVNDAELKISRQRKDLLLQRLIHHSDESTESW